MSKMVVILIVAIAPTNLEAADTAFRFQNPAQNSQALDIFGVLVR